MIAALPMYDRAEVHDATDAFWVAIRDALRNRGISAPNVLCRDGDLWAIWRHPDLVLAQTCGLPYRAHLAPHVTLVATPDYDLPGCPPGHYNSVIVARAAVPAIAKPAVNDALSQSGWAALLSWADDTGQRLSPPVMTGTHESSARAVADGQADIAAIDAQTWRLMCRSQSWTRTLVEVARTRPTPGLPLITASGTDPAPIRDALNDAFVSLAPDLRAELDLNGFPLIAAKAYLDLPIPPNI